MSPKEADKRLITMVDRSKRKIPAAAGNPTPKTSFNEPAVGYLPLMWILSTVSHPVRSQTGEKNRGSQGHPYTGGRYPGSLLMIAISDQTGYQGSPAGPKDVGYDDGQHVYR
jgi:hypothetical protein